jgi:hypothetical protein
MKNIYIKRIYSLTIFFVLLFAPLPLTSIAENIVDNLSEIEREAVLYNRNTVYIYLGEELSDIKRIVTSIKDLDYHKKSPIIDLSQHIETGFLIGRQDAVLDALHYAELTLQDIIKKHHNDNVQQLYNDLQLLMSKIISAELVIDIQSVQCDDQEHSQDSLHDMLVHRGPQDFVVDNNLKVLGKTLLKRHLHTKQGAHIEGKLEVDKKALFKNRVIIKKLLSAAMASIGNLTVQTLTVINCVNHLCVNNLVALDTLSAGDTALESLAITGVPPTSSRLKALRSPLGGLSVVGPVTLTILTPAGVVHNNVSGNLSSSLIVDADIAVATITNDKLATVSSTGTPGSLVVYDGSGHFTASGIGITGTPMNPTDVATVAYVNSQVGGSGTNLNTPDVLVLRDDTGSFAAQAISMTDAVISNSTIITPFSVSGVIHNNAGGLLSSSLIVDADITAATITNDKLATVSSAGTPANLVVYDGSGHFTASGISITGTPVNPTDVATVAYVNSQVGESGTNLNTPNTLVLRDSTGSFAAQVISMTDAVISNSATITPFNTPGVVHNSIAGLLSSSLIVNADITNGTITNNKLATVASTGTPGSLVMYDGSGHFTANSISITGTPVNPTDAATVAYVNAQVGVGGTSLNTPNTLVLRDSTGSFAAQVISMTDAVISNSATITPFNTQGVVHNDVTGLLSSSLIVNADITAATITNDKLETVSSTAIPGSLVVYDSAGHFTASGISITGIPVNPTDAATKAYVDAQVGVGGTSLNTPNTLVLRDGTGSFAAQVISMTDAVMSNSVTITPFNTSGVVHNNAAGLLSSSLIVDADITAAIITNDKLATVSSTGTPGSIVVYDGSGHFTASGISITGTPVNPTDAATVAYVNNVAGAGIIAKNPAIVVSTTDIGSPPAGLQTIDGVTLVDGNRVLLVGQTNAVQNGLWLAHAGNWTRPTDFATGNEAQGAYVLILSGTVNGGSSWLCNTPTAVIDTDPITFAEFGLPNQISGANVGAGTGLIFKNKTGITLNFKSLIASNHIVITNNTSDITLATDAANANTPSTIVARDGSGNFTTNMITITGTTTNATDVATKAYVDAHVGGSSTNLNTPNTVVKRDGTGSFAAQVISMTDGVHSGNLILSTEPSSATAGNVLKGTSRFIHDFGTNNTFVGLNAGNFTMTGSGGNSGFGINALTLNSTGAFNTAVGTGTLAANTTGTHNTALGYNALTVNTIGANNTALGYLTLAANTTGAGNVAIGNQSLKANTIGTNNTAVGNNALTVNTSGFSNTAVGSNALAALTTGTVNTALGIGTLQSLTTGAGNIGIGNLAGSNCTGNESFNIYIANSGVAAESNAIRIGGATQNAAYIVGINGATTLASAVPVVIDSNNKLGTNGFYQTQTSTITFQASDLNGTPQGGPNLSFPVTMTRIGNLVTIDFPQVSFTPTNSPGDYPVIYTANAALPAAYIPFNETVGMFQSFINVDDQVPVTLITPPFGPPEPWIPFGGCFISDIGDIAIWSQSFLTSSNWSQPGTGWMAFTVTYKGS